MARTPQEEANVRLVLELFNTVLIPMDKTRVDEFIAPDYLQHSSLAEPGREPLKAWLDFVRKETPQATQKIYRVFAEDDHVITHQHVTRWPGDPGFAVCDIFRIADGKIVEHWDVLQEISATPVNPNSMFENGV
ncbi:nuclear transport factor 2 family protein [Sphingobium nicotianae]|uniref:Nuclear transport factor 2 family protein n=1 Tax=Sphingobium nicotianae TaxID=2782607 RepID=A0A9X1AJ89_9SPHN|nr:nuclear transport factor 2 family protein [Sphingobium nicotianae]MBT2185473.1 nuclear transport factor 2 family protein [Sphingobium nicotianae]